MTFHVKTQTLDMDWFQLHHLASFKDDPLSQAGAQLGVWKLVKVVKGNHSAEKQVPSATHAHLVHVHTCVYAHVHSDTHSDTHPRTPGPHAYTHVYTHTYTQTHTHACTSGKNARAHTYTHEHTKSFTH